MKNYNDLPDAPWIRYADTNGEAFPDEYTEDEEESEDEIYDE